MGRRPKDGTALCEAKTSNRLPVRAEEIKQVYCRSEASAKLATATTLFMPCAETGGRATEFVSR